MPIIQLPEPAAARVQSIMDDDIVITVQLGVRDAAHRDSLLALLEKAERSGYAIEIKLIHYEGCANTEQQRQARQARKATGDLPKKE